MASRYARARRPFELSGAPAEGLLDAYHGEWNGSVDPLFIDCMY